MGYSPWFFLKVCNYSKPAVSMAALIVIRLSSLIIHHEVTH
uniref:Uncharacterized protein n=1 Tax=Amphimedon queenslandica TaxID=400682 RepID=A0A1X7UI83_AMPQE